MQKMTKIGDPSKKVKNGICDLLRNDPKRVIFWTPLKSVFVKNDHFMDRFTREYILACVKNGIKKVPKNGTFEGGPKWGQNTTFWGHFHTCTVPQMSHSITLDSIGGWPFFDQKRSKCHFCQKGVKSDPKMAKNDQKRGSKMTPFWDPPFPYLGGIYWGYGPKRGPKRGSKSDQKGSFWTP